jgi:hypothetical protein
MDETREVAVKREDSLLTLAIEKGVDTDTLEKLISLRNAEIARQAKADFDAEFAKMQAEFVPVGKTNKASDRDGNKLYSYCPIEVILQMAAPIIARHGFAYSWEEEALPTKEKRIWCIISGYGHERRGYVDIPFMEPSTRATNAVQMRGSATTYGKRYSFLNATGIIVAGEDNDALSLSNTAAVRAEVVMDAPEGIHANVSNQFGPLPPADDPLEAVRAEIKTEIAHFVALCGAEFNEVPYFTDAEKADFKVKIAAVNEGAKAEKDIAKGLDMKLRDLKTLNGAISEELDKRKAGTPLEQAMTAALKGKNGAEPQQELY